MLRWHVISAVFSRNFKQYFTSVLGYLFIVVFVTVCAILTFSPQFFADNLANLDQLSKYYPALLLFFVPAITMSVWADEKKQGTDAILFTLPASDLEILLGKFFSVVAVYTVALIFSVTQLIALQAIGDPDWGVIGSTYVGYWLAGVALLSVGMFASSLTGSTTVAFVVGALLCAVPILFNWFGPLLAGLVNVFAQLIEAIAGDVGFVRWLNGVAEFMVGNQFVQAFALENQLRDFRLGQISFPGVVYFVSLTVFMLYLNLVVISKRHWSRGRQVTLSGHFTVRIIALAVGLLSITILAENSSAIFNNRVDLTSEALYSLDQTTRDTIENAAENDRPVTIQAFLSTDVPRQYVSTRKHLVGLLRQYDRLGGNNIDVRFVDVEPNSDEIEEARTLGIEPKATRDTVAGKVVEQNVYLGAVVTSTLGEVTLPFIDGDTSIEYQLTRSLATTTDQDKRLRLGILKTDAHFGNLEAQGRVYDWIAPRTLAELEKQYEIVRVSPEELTDFNQEDKPESDESDNKSADKSTKNSDSDESKKDANDKQVDVLLVVDPSSLTMTGIFNLVSFIEAGNPTLVLADPLPFYWFTYQAPRQLGIINAPRQPRISPRAAWAPVASSPQEKAFGGAAMPLLNTLGIDWKFDRIVWNLYNPHVGFKPKLPDRFQDRWPDHYGPKQNLFVFARSFGTHIAFNPENEISSGLQEVMFVYPGSLQPVKNDKTEFIPLVTLKQEGAGHFDWDEFTQNIVSTRQSINQFTGQLEEQTGPEENFYTGGELRLLKKNPRKNISSRNVAGTDGQDGSDDGQAKLLDPWSHVLAAQIKGKGDSKINVVFIADTDFATDMYFEQQPALEQPLDNFTFLVNAIEALAGDSSFVRLRNRRATPRTLSRLEAMTDEFRQDAAKKQETIENEINLQLVDAQTELDKQTEKIQGDQELSVMQKIQQSVFSADVAERKFQLKKEKLDKQLEKEIDRIHAEEQQQIDAVESRVRFWSIFLAGFPALILGCFVLAFRTYSEKREIDPQRKV